MNAGVPPPAPRPIRRALRAVGRQIVGLYTDRRSFGNHTLALAVLLLLITFTERARFEPNRVVVQYVLLLWLVIPTRWLIGVVRPRGRRHPRYWRSATALILLFLTVMPIYPWSRHCQHGDVWMLGRVGIAASPMGKPCDAALPDRLAIPVGGTWYVVVNPWVPVAGRWR